MRFGLRELIFIVVLLVVPVASYIYVFKPRNDEIKQAQEEVRVKQARLEKLRQVASKIDDLGIEIDRGREAIDLIEAKLPSQQDVEVILKNVWQLAEQARLNWEKLGKKGDRLLDRKLADMERQIAKAKEAEEAEEGEGHEKDGD